MGVRYQLDRQGFSISSPYILSENISLESAVYIGQIGNELPGVRIEEVPVRGYQDGTSAPHIIGRVGTIVAEELDSYLEKGYTRDQIVGRDGIEKLYEENLQGTDGKRIVTLNNRREVIENEITEEPIPGSTVVLTLDKNLQNIALDALKSQIEYLNATAPTSQGKEADSGAAVAIDVKTGEILVLASYPGYDLATMSTEYGSLANDPLRPLFNRSLQGQYTPGSIFKPLVSLAALNEGVVTESTRITCNRVYSFSPGYNPTCLGTHGPFTVRDALRRSCNVYYYDCGKNLGIARVNQYAPIISL